MDIKKNKFKKLKANAEDSLFHEDFEDNTLVLVDNEPMGNLNSNEEQMSLKYPKESYEISSANPSLQEEISTINTESNETSIDQKYIQPEIDWKREALIGNFMPATVKLHKKEINVNDIIDPISENRLIHLAVTYSFLNVTRCFLEIFECDINSKNIYGQTPLHIICNNQSKDAFLFSYLIKNENIEIDAVDKSGFTPLFYSVMNNFKVATMALAYLKCDLSQIDNFGNNVIYHAIIAGNKFALNFLLRHKETTDINQKYYKGDASLADILITNRISSVTKHFIKYYHDDIKLESIESCRKLLNQFPHYNKFNYDILNTLYYYKTRNFFGFLRALLRKDEFGSDNIDNINSIDENSSPKHGYSFKYYNLKIFIYDLLIKNTGNYIKYFPLLVYILTMFFLTYRLSNFILSNLEDGLNLTNLFSLFTFLNIFMYLAIFISISLLYKFYFYKYQTKFYDETQYNLTNPLYSTDHVAHQIYQAMERNPLDIFFEEEICEICLTKKAKSTNHCHDCKRCVPDFYFHSKFFNICFSRKNIYSYILFLSCIVLIHFGLMHFTYLSLDYEIVNSFPDSKYIGEDSYGHKTIYSSDNLTTNIITFLMNISLIRLIWILGLFVTGVLYLQSILSYILCAGYNVTYYNMFRYHKKSLGEIKLRNNLYYNIPHVNLVSLPRFVKNLFSMK